MKRSLREAAMRGSRHLHRLSLPTVRCSGPFEGAEILAEVPSALALPLCLAYRSVMAWALIPREEHPGLFSSGAADPIRDSLRAGDLPDEVEAALEAVCELLGDPTRTDPQRVSAACVRLAEWADRQAGAPATAFRFVQAAGMCMPNDSRLAYRAGAVARRQANWDVAELWFRHSGTVSRRTRDWEAHATAYLGLGNSYLQQGRYAAAQREHRKALRVGTRHGLDAIRGAAFHNLFSIAVETKDASGAERCARFAFDAYGSGHPTIPALSHDIAYFWLVQGQFRRAFPVFQALLSHFRRPEDRLRVLASLGHAAGGIGDRPVFEWTWDEVWRAASDLEGSSVLVTSLAELARGAVRLGECERAREAAARAFELACQRGEADVAAGAEGLLLSLAQGEAAVVAMPSPLPEPSPDEDLLAVELVSSLEAMAERS